MQKRLQLDEERDQIEPLDVLLGDAEPLLRAVDEEFQFDPLPFSQSQESPSLQNEGLWMPPLLGRSESAGSLFEDVIVPGEDPMITLTASPRIRSLSNVIMSGAKSGVESDDQFTSSPDHDDEQDATSESKQTAQSHTEPPRLALDSEEQGEEGKLESFHLKIVHQPPREVRTRKKKEKRSFAVKARLVGLPESSVVSCRLVFADDYTPVPEEDECSQRIIANPEDNQEILFQNLGIMSPCLKWKDREFCLEITVFDAKDEKAVIERVWTRRIYAYSNIGVLQRRREVEVVALSAKNGPAEGGMRMHLVGKPFFKSDRLKVVFRVCLAGKWTSFDCKDLEFYSESVLFFTTPKIPLEYFMTPGQGRIARGRRMVIKVFVQVTNDGVNFSNGIEFAVHIPRVVQSRNNFTMAGNASTSSDVSIFSFVGAHHPDEELQSRL